MELNLCAVIEPLLEEKRLIETLLELSREKKQVIIKCDTEQLDRIVQKEARLVLNLNAAEKKRASAAAAAARELGIPASAVTLRALAEQAHGSEKTQLDAVLRELPPLLKEQTELNQLNQQLLETQIEYTDVMLGMIVGEEDPLNNFYGGDGKTESEKRRSAGLFDHQI